MCMHGQTLWKLCSNAKGTHLKSCTHSIITSIMCLFTIKCWFDWWKLKWSIWQMKATLWHLVMNVATGTAAAGVTPKFNEHTPIDACWYCNAQNPPNFLALGLLSDYLHSRCPCCFGGSTAAASGLQVDFIVSLDANFQLKQIQDYDWHATFKGQKLLGSQDPKMTLPLTIEMPHTYAEEWKDKLEKMHMGNTWNIMQEGWDGTVWAWGWHEGCW